MKIYGSWNWFISSTTLRLISLRFYCTDPQNHMMNATEAAIWDKIYFFHQAIPHLPTRGNNCSNIYDHRLILPFLEPHMNGNTQSYNLLFQALFIQHFFCFEIYSCCSNCWVVLHSINIQPFLLLFLIDGCLDFFQFGAIMNKAAMNIVVQVFVWIHCLHLSWIKKPEMKLLGYMANVCLAL